MGKKLRAIEKKLSEAQKQIKEAQEELAEYKRTQKLPLPEIGGTIEIAGVTWKVLDKTEKGYVCLAERLKDGRQFDSNCNDWKKSELRKYLNTEFYKELAAEVGEENIIPFERDLLSLDGQTEYGTCEDKVSLLTVDEYRKYRKHIPNTETYFWWTITSDSTKCNKDTTWVTVVSPWGNVDCFSYFNDDGVRPVCIFSSAIFESEDK